MKRETSKNSLVIRLEDEGFQLCGLVRIGAVWRGLARWRGIGSAAEPEKLSWNILEYPGQAGTRRNTSRWLMVEGKPEGIPEDVELCGIT